MAGRPESASSGEYSGTIRREFTDNRHEFTAFTGVSKNGQMMNDLFKRQARRGKTLILWPAQGLDTVLDAAALRAATVPRARFQFMDGGIDVDRLQRRRPREAITQRGVFAAAAVSAAQAILRTADVLLVHLKDVLFLPSLPKLRHVSRRGGPSSWRLCGDAADLVMRTGASVLAERGNPASIAEAVLQRGCRRPSSPASENPAGGFMKASSGEVWREPAEAASRSNRR